MRTIATTLLLLSGCVAPGMRPGIRLEGPPARARLLSAGEVEVIAPTTPVRLRPSTELRLGSSIHAAAANGAVEVGECIIGVPFRHPAPHAEGTSRTTFSLKATSAALANGSGDDPLTVLWMEFEGRLWLPLGEQGGAVYGPTRWAVADPAPRPWSEWFAEDAALLEERATLLAEEAGVALITEVMGPTRPARCALEGGAHGRAHDAHATEPAQVAGLATQAPGAERELSAPMAPLQVGDAAPSSATIGSDRAVSAMAGAVEGFKMGEACLILGPAALPCIVGAATIGAVMGTAAGGGPKRSDAAKWASERARATEGSRNPWKGPLLDALHGGDIERRFRSALSRAGPVPIEAAVTRVRFVQSGLSGEAAFLQVEVIARAAGAPAGAERWLCMAGPGPLPSRLWVRDVGGLVGSVLDAVFARAVRSAAAPPTGGVEEMRCDDP